MRFPPQSARLAAEADPRTTEQVRPTTAALLGAAACGAVAGAVDGGLLGLPVVFLGPLVVSCLLRAAPRAMAGAVAVAWLLAWGAAGGWLHATRNFVETGAAAAVGTLAALALARVDGSPWRRWGFGLGGVVCGVTAAGAAVPPAGVAFAVVLLVAFASRRGLRPWAAALIGTSLGAVLLPGAAGEARWSSQMALLAASIVAHVLAPARRQPSRGPTSMAWPATLTGSHAWLWSIDLDGNYVYVNHAFARLLGRAPKDLIGASVSAAGEGYGRRLRGHLANQRSTRDSLLYLDNAIRTAAGAKVPVESTFEPVFDGDGRHVGYRGIDRDLTDRRRALAELVRDGEEIAEIDKVLAWGTLVRAVTHDVNNPNHAIRLSADVLAKLWEVACGHLERGRLVGAGATFAGMSFEEMRDEVRALIGDIRQSSDRIKSAAEALHGYVEDSPPQRHEPLDLVVVSRAVLGMMRSLLQRWSRACELDLGAEQLMVRGNPQRLQQLLVHLLLTCSRQLRDHDAGLAVRLARGGHRGDLVELSVRCQTDDPDLDVFSTARSLSISRRILREHGGSMRVHHDHGWLSLHAALPAMRAATASGDDHRQQVGTGGRTPEASVDSAG